VKKSKLIVFKGGCPPALEDLFDDILVSYEGNYPHGPLALWVNLAKGRGNLWLPEKIGGSKIVIYLATSTGLKTSIKSSYIVVFTKMQKIATPKNEVCLSDIRKCSVFEIMLSFDL